MELTVRARRMMESCPSYYWGNDFFERIIQGIANEIDRLEARAEKVRDGLVPTTADDEVGLLGVWEAIVGIPVEPPGASPIQRRAKITARLQAIGESSAAATVAALRAAAGTLSVNVARNTPVPLVDTISMPFDENTYNAAQVQAFADVLWPAHRDHEMRYSQGFILDVGRLDEDEF